VCPLVHHLPPVLPRSRGDYGRARHPGCPHNDPSVGASICPRVREAGTALPDRSAHRGGWTRPTFQFVADDYLYRAVDKHGKTVDFLLRRDRGIAAAQAFFRKALISVAPRVPRKIALDGHVPSRRALWLLRHEHPCWRNVTVRTNRYLNNVIEQDHRAIKRRCASMAGFKSFANASIAIAAIELAHRIRKRQFILGRNRPRRGWSLKHEWAIALA